MKHRLVLMCCTVFSCCFLFAQVPNKKLIPFQQGEATLYFLSVTIALPDTIYLQLSDTISGITTEAKRKQWRNSINTLVKEISCQREKGGDESEIEKLEKNKKDFERKLSKGISEKMIGKDELVFTVLIQRMFKSISNEKLATEKVLFLFNQMKTFYEEYANAVDENSIPDSIQHKINLLKQQIAKSNDSIENKAAQITQLRIQKRFRRYHPSIRKSTSNSLTNSPDSVKKLKERILEARVARKKSIAFREGLAEKVIDYKSYYANPSLFLTGNALSYLEDEEPVTTAGLGIYSKKSDLWEFSAYVTISQTRDLIRAEFNDREVF